MKKSKPRGVIGIHLKLREVIRTTIGNITLFPRGFKNKKYVDQLGFKDKGKILYGGIDNKDWRFYRLGLRGCRFTRACYPPVISERPKEIRLE